MNSHDVAAFTRQDDQYLEEILALMKVKAGTKKEYKQILNAC